MATDDQYALLYNKKILPLDQMGPKFLSYLINQLRNYGADTFSTDAVLGTSLVAVAGTGVNRVNVSSGVAFQAVTGTGRKIKCLNTETRLLTIKVPPVVTTFTIGIEANDVETGIEVNPRTGAFQYVSMVESMGRVAAPNSVIDNLNGTMTLIVDTLFQAGDDHSGRSVRVWLKTVENGGIGPQSSAAAIAIQTIVSTFSGGNNRITIPNYLGQSVPSPTAANYVVQAVGPTVTRKATEDLANTVGCFYLADITGVTAGNLITTIDTSRQNNVAIPLSDLDGRVVDLETSMNAFERSCIVSTMGTSFINSGNAGLNFPVSTGSALIAGRIVNPPAVTVALTNNTLNYVYVDSSTGTVVSNITFPPFPSMVLYTVITSAGSIGQITDWRRAATRNNSRDCVTVGTANCDFLTLEGAIEWLAANRTAGEGIICEVVIQGIVTTTRQIPINFPVIIRGAAMNGQVGVNPQLRTFSGGVAFTNSVASLDRVAFRDLMIQVGGTSPASGSAFFLSNASLTTLGDHWEFSNITFSGSMDAHLINIQGFTSTGPTGWRFNNVTFNTQSANATPFNAVFLGSGASIGTPVNGFSFRNCRFLGQSGNLNNQGIQIDNNVFDILIENCEFNSGGIAVLLRNACDQINIERCRFKNQRTSTISNATDGEVNIDNNYFTTSLAAGPANAIIEINTISTHGGGLCCVRNNRFKDWTQGNAILISAGSHHRIEGNTFKLANTLPNANVAITCNRPMCSFINNEFDQYFTAIGGAGRPGATVQCIALTSVTPFGSRIIGNKFMNNGSTAFPSTSGCISNAANGAIIANNQFLNCWGTTISASGGSIITGNQDDSSAIDSVATTKRITVSGTDNLIFGNTAYCTGANALAIDSTGGATNNQNRIFGNNVQQVTTNTFGQLTVAGWTGLALRKRVTFDPPSTNVPGASTVIASTIAMPNKGMGVHIPMSISLPAALNANTYQAGVRFTFGNGVVNEVFNATAGVVITDLASTQGLLTSDDAAIVKVDFIIRNTTGGALNLDLGQSIYEGWVI